MLSSVTIDKFVRESFADGECMIVNPDEMDKLANQIRQRLSGFSTVRFASNFQVITNASLKVVLDLELFEPAKSQYYQRTNDFRIACTRDRRLLLTDHYDLWVNVATIDEVVEFVRRCHERIMRRQVQDTKRNKVQSLNIQGVLAQIKAVAKQDRFDFCLVPGRFHVDLLVRFEGKSALQIRLSFEHFENQLPQVREVIKDALKWRRYGVNFTTITVGQYYDDKWISHESL